jgi:endonuclease/exonuclease/phosphatase family metal-dependent hydrolase
MPPFPKPAFEYDYDVQAQLAALREYEANEPGRAVPARAANRFLLATWNIANLGHEEQVRREQDYQLIAELLSWFDLIAIQEVNDDLTGLRGLQRHLPASYRVLLSDRAGNNERLAFLYDENKVRLLEKVGEIAIPPSESRNIRLKGIEQKFDGFDRNPYLAAFQAGALTFLLVSVHLYFGTEKGKTSKRDMNRRSLETYAVARWADLRRKSANAYTRNIIALGDFNMPKAEPGDPIYEALTRRGLRLPQHSTEMGSAIKKDRHYDQLAFFPPGETEHALVQASAVFDFDGAIFRTLWQNRGPEAFFSYVRYYISDHRLLWAELRL